MSYKFVPDSTHTIGTRKIPGHHTNATKFKCFNENGSRITFSDFFSNLKDKKSFRTLFREVIISKYPDYPYVFFECPPVNETNFTKQHFEFVLTSTNLFEHKQPEYKLFSNQLDSKDCLNNGSMAYNFYNLRK